MNDFLASIVAAIITFAATNVDDIFILMLFFSQPAAAVPRRSIIIGQFAGFTALVLISLLGFLVGLAVPRAWIGLLGIVPIFLGVRAWLNRKKDNDKETEEQEQIESASKTSKNGLLASVLSVATITFANGGDNIGIYTPLFASINLPRLLLTLAVFYVLLGVWCLAGYLIARQPHVARVLTHYAHFIVPFVLTALGIFILYESESYKLFWRDR